MVTFIVVAQFIAHRNGAYCRRLRDYRQPAARSGATGWNAVSAFG